MSRVNSEIGPFDVFCQSKNNNSQAQRASPTFDEKFVNIDHFNATGTL